jgi:hypothetical protein
MGTKYAGAAYSSVTCSRSLWVAGSSQSGIAVGFGARGHRRNNLTCVPLGWLDKCKLGDCTHPVYQRAVTKSVR